MISVMSYEEVMTSKRPPFNALPIHFLFFLSLTCSFVFSYEQVCNHQDQHALLAFSANISTSPSLPLNWSSSTYCCQWEGIGCDINGRVIRLELPSKGLRGTISPSISNLVMLTHLNLSNNYLHGALVNDITRLKKLLIIDLSLNSLLGPIPHEIGKLLYLKKFYLNENKFSGQIPSSLMNCTHLVEIIFRDNNLSGDISRLDFSKLIQLRKLDLAVNGLNGPLPKSIYFCISLVAFRVSHNNITGQISSKISNMKSLSFLSITSNNFTNITMTLRVLPKCKSLTFLSISHNFYGETLPVQKHFIGLGEYQKLQLFDLSDCKFEAGPIPNWLFKMKNLRVLNLFGLRLSGKIPIWLGTLLNLFSLNLNNNNLNGDLPKEFLHLPALISHNSTQANIKLHEFELPVFSSRTNNNYISSVRFIDNIVHGLFLSNNALCGNIPKEIGRLQNLHTLILSQNHFSGLMPFSISNLKNLEHLDLSENNLTGEIPTSLASLNFLSYFNVSYNNLKGSIPTGGQFNTFEKSSFVGNPDLCGELLNHPCHRHPTPSKAMDRTESHDHKMQKFLDGLYVGFALGFSSILIVVASYVWFNYFKACHTSSRR